MTYATIFNGKISVSIGTRLKKQLSFKFDTKDLSINEVVMANFKSFNFNDFEKRELSSEHRKIIYNYQNLCCKKLDQYTKELIKLIESASEESEIKIEAYEAGTFICLAAIFSGKLKTKSQISFDLYSSPIKLFPKNLTRKKKAPKDIEINLHNKTSRWLSKFESLAYSNPMIKYKAVDEEEEQYLKTS